MPGRGCLAGWSASAALMSGRSASRPPNWRWNTRARRCTRCASGIRPNCASRPRNRRPGHECAALATWDMLRKYRGQLATAGIGYDDLPRPAGADELEAGRREQARQRAREHAQHWREQQYRQARTYLRCDADGGQVILAFPYDP